MRKFALTATLLVAAMAFAGCEASIGTEDEKTQLEKIIKTQLPQKIEENGQGTITVSSVDCVERVEHQYDCNAAVSGETPDGKSIKETLTIDGSCDKEECIWKTK